MLTIIVAGLLPIAGLVCADLALPSRDIDPEPRPTLMPFHAPVDGSVMSDLSKHTTMMSIATSLIDTRKMVFQAQDGIDANPVKHGAEYQELAVTQDKDYSALYCSGSDLKKKDIVGVCMDGNFLWYSAFDCDGKCKCDDAGKVSCDIPSDCGPQRDVVDYCMGNPMFNCTCMANTMTAKKLQKNGVGTDEVSGRNADVKDTHPLAPTNHELKARSDAEQDEDEGVPLISPCFWDPLMSCGPYTPESRRTQHPYAHSTTLATVVK